MIRRRRSAPPGRGATRGGSCAWWCSGRCRRRPSSRRATGDRLGAFGAVGPAISRAWGCRVRRRRTPRRPCPRRSGALGPQFGMGAVRVHQDREAAPGPSRWRCPRSGGIHTGGGFCRGLGSTSTRRSGSIGRRWLRRSFAQAPRTMSAVSRKRRRSPRPECEGGELAGGEAAAGAPVHPPAREHVQKRHLFGQAQGVVERGQRDRRAMRSGWSSAAPWSPSCAPRGRRWKLEK